MNVCQGEFLLWFLLFTFIEHCLCFKNVIPTSNKTDKKNKNLFHILYFGLTANKKNNQSNMYSYFLSTNKSAKCSICKEF